MQGPTPALREADARNTARDSQWVQTSFLSAQLWAWAKLMVGKLMEHCASSPSCLGTGWVKRVPNQGRWELILRCTEESVLKLSSTLAMFKYLRNFSWCIFASSNSLLKVGLEGRGRWGAEELCLRLGCRWILEHRMSFGVPRLTKDAFWDSSPFPFTCILCIGWPHNILLLCMQV